ncbi:MAG TPA: GH25 family lysozyme [Bacteroidales bacterium]|nr:GH25 family lysozyme [Bacteroidales bacterium]
MNRNKVILLAVIIPIISISMLGAAYYFRAPIKALLIKVHDLICPPPPPPDTCWGIDISHHQKSVDWELLVEKNKPDFIFLKATEGSSHTDSKYSEYAAEARKQGIPVGAYHFFSYNSSGKQQASNFIKTARLSKGDLFPVLDVEFRKNMKDRKWIIAEISSFCKEIKKEYGVNPIIYCEYDYYKKYLEDDFGDFNYWISDFYREPRCNYVFWQYTDKGMVEGIGKIDNNRMNKVKKLEDYIL